MRDDPTTDAHRVVPHVTVYGDFNCPFSALASTRVANLERQGLGRVEWNAVEHDPSIPNHGEPLSSSMSTELQRELAMIRDLLASGEPDRLVLPSRRVNTERATSAYAAAAGPERAALRERLFAAYWQHDRDLGNDDVLGELGAVGADAPVAARWQHEWMAIPRPLVPVIVLEDGYVSRGIGALARLRGAIDGEIDRLVRE